MKISITAEKTKQPTLINRMGIIPNAPNRTPPMIGPIRPARVLTILITALPCIRSCLSTISGMLA